jgi:hypothetical protein
MLAAPLWLGQQAEGDRKAESVHELKLAELDDSQQRKPIIPSLYDAQLINMHGRGMLFSRS